MDDCNDQPFLWEVICFPPFKEEECHNVEQITTHVLASGGNYIFFLKKQACHIIHCSFTTAKLILEFMYKLMFQNANFLKE